MNAPPSKRLPERFPETIHFNILKSLSCKEIILSLERRKIPELTTQQWQTLTNNIHSPAFDNLNRVDVINQDEGQYMLINHYDNNDAANKLYTKCMYVHLQRYHGNGMKYKWYQTIRINSEDTTYFRYFTNVTVIGRRTFEWQEPKLTKVTIPDSVTSIGDFAFSNNLLKEVTIPDSVTSIGDFAFSKNLLEEVNIPEGITKISHGAFKENQLQQIKIPDSVTIIEGAAFRYNKLKKVKIPYGVTTIGEYAFANNNITEIEIPDSVIWIKEHAFINNNIRDITVPENTYVEEGAFWLYRGAVKIKRRKSVVNNSTSVVTLKSLKF